MNTYLETYFYLRYRILNHLNILNLQIDYRKPEN